MDEQVQYRTILSELFGQYTAFFFVGVAALFLIKAAINSDIINERDNNDRSFLLFNPFSNRAWDHYIQCMSKFYWRPIGEAVSQKRAVNFLSLIFGLFMLVLIVNWMVEHW